MVLLARLAELEKATDLTAENKLMTDEKVKSDQENAELAGAAELEKAVVLFLLLKATAEAKKATLINR